MVNPCVNVIDRLENYTMVFRGNNAAPRIITAFIHSQAGSYLSDTLGPLLRRVIRDPRLKEIDLDLSKVAPEERLRNIGNIQAIAQSFLDAIFESADNIPRALKETFHHIAQCTTPRFREAHATHIVVGSMVFLRFICPAISIPTNYLRSGETLPPETMKALVLITKIIQNLASNAQFQEQNMAELNEVLHSNIKRVLGFIRAVSVTPFFFIN